MSMIHLTLERAVRIGAPRDKDPDTVEWLFRMSVDDRDETRSVRVRVSINGSNLATPIWQSYDDDARAEQCLFHAVQSIRAHGFPPDENEVTYSLTGPLYQSLPTVDRGIAFAIRHTALRTHSFSA